jgi:Ca2+ insensitive EF hand
VTELDLQQSLIPAALIEHLGTVMPTNTTREGYDYNSFLDVLVNGTTGNGVKHSPADGGNGGKNWM